MRHAYLSLVFLRNGRCGRRRCGCRCICRCFSGFVRFVTPVELENPPLRRAGRATLRIVLHRTAGGVARIDVIRAVALLYTYRSYLPALPRFDNAGIRLRTANRHRWSFAFFQFFELRRCRFCRRRLACCELRQCKKCNASIKNRVESGYAHDDFQERNELQIIGYLSGYKRMKIAETGV